MAAVNIWEAMRQIEAFVLDIDGVLTQGHIYFLKGGEMLRDMYVRDGYAVQHLLKKGYKMSVISGGKGLYVTERLVKLGVPASVIYTEVTDKKAQFLEWCQSEGVAPDRCVYMGDDMPDLAVMDVAGLAACPKNACSEVLKKADYISSYEGGKGCVRDIVEQVLKVQNNWL